MGKGFDIYQWATEFDADYLDPNSGNVFHVQDYNRLTRMGLPTPGIAVTDYKGEFIGYAERVGESA
jgi:hypothetical protein